jgi:hypothetical protein
MLAVKASANVDEAADRGSREHPAQPRATTGHRGSDGPAGRSVENILARSPLGRDLLR